MGALKESTFTAAKNMPPSLEVSCPECSMYGFPYKAVWVRRYADIWRSKRLGTTGEMHSLTWENKMRPPPITRSYCSGPPTALLGDKAASLYKAVILLWHTNRLTEG